MRPHVLIIDDDAGLREALTVVLEEEFAVHTAATGEEGLALLQRLPIPVVILDLGLPGMPGLEVLSHIKALDPQSEILILTATHAGAVVVRAMQAGASDYLTKPFDVEALQTRVRTAFAQYRARQPALLAALAPPLGVGLVGQSPPMQQVLVLLHTVADTLTTVLLTGERGTGKALLARALHQASPRRDRPFVVLHCAAMPEELVTRTFVDPTRDASTDATPAFDGVLAQAHTGSLFLDEVNGLSPAAQDVLLRVLQEREGTRHGSLQSPPADVRLIAATTQDLRQMVRAGTFREDVFQRLNGMPITVPPLRERPTDIPLLVGHFLAQYNRELSRQVPGLTAAALAVLCAYAWPGNVRELKHVMRRLVMRGTQRVLEVGEVQALLQEPGGQGASRGHSQGGAGGGGVGMR
jgi:DNA-binding NtrC family response regulator